MIPLANRAYADLWAKHIQAYLAFRAFPSDTTRIRAESTYVLWAMKACPLRLPQLAGALRRNLDAVRPFAAAS